MKPLQQFRFSAQALPLRTQRQRPWRSVFVRPFRQMPVQQSPSFAQRLSLRVPSPHGLAAPGLPSCLPLRLAAAPLAIPASSNTPRVDFNPSGRLAVAQSQRATESNSR
jgi:hypothetical protein